MDVLLETPPSRKRLKELFLDPGRGKKSAAEVNCAAHMILMIDEPAEVATIALDYLIEHVGACGADLGFATPKDQAYSPIAARYNRSAENLRCDNTSYANQSYIFRRAWHGSGPVACDDVASHPHLKDCRDIFTAIGSKSMLLQRLTFGRHPVGILCMDFTDKVHVWTDDERNDVAVFCRDSLGPLLGISHYWNRRPATADSVRRPSDAELDAIRLTAQGLSCDEIAEALGKSPRTVENQLRNARLSLLAANRAELIRKCEVWL